MAATLVDLWSMDSVETTSIHDGARHLADIVTHAFIDGAV